MNDIESNSMGIEPMLDVHASTCLLMTRFISGRHCPKLAHLIVRQLAQLLAQPQLLPDSRALYQNLLDHWQAVTDSLIQQKQPKRQQSTVH